MLGDILLWKILTSLYHIHKKYRLLIILVSNDVIANRDLKGWLKNLYFVTRQACGYVYVILHYTNVSG